MPLSRTTEPAYPDASEIPLVTDPATRLTFTRRKQLIKAASRPRDAPPPPPGFGECCGGHCQPCVQDLWKEEKTAWMQRWGVVEGQEEDGRCDETSSANKVDVSVSEGKGSEALGEDVKQQEAPEKEKMPPGGFDW